MTEKSNQFKARVRSEAGDFVKRDLLGSSEWKASKLGYLTGVSSIVRGGSSAFRMVGTTVGSTTSAIRSVFRRETVQPLETSSTDPAERFRVAQAAYGRSDAEVETMVVRSARQTWVHFILLLLLTGWATHLALKVEKVDSIFLDLLFPFFPLLISLPLFLRSGFWNWQLRRRRLDSVGEYLRSPSHWLPPARLATSHVVVMVIIGSLAALLVPDVALANTDRLGFLQAATTDGSDVFMRTLSILAGGIGPVPELVGDDSPWIVPLGRAFGAFNGALLAISAAMLGWHTLSGMIATAHEGKVLGQKWHQIWAPVRVTAGVGTLVPVAEGFSVIQVIVLQIAVWGSALANEVWDAYIDAFATPAYLAGIDSEASREEYSQALWKLSRDEDASDMILGLFEKQVCLAGLAEGANIIREKYISSTGQNVRGLADMDEAERVQVFSANNAQSRAFIEASGISLADETATSGPILTFSEVESRRVDHWVGLEHDGWFSDSLVPLTSVTNGNWDWNTFSQGAPASQTLILWNFGEMCGQIRMDLTSPAVVANFLEQHGRELSAMEEALNRIVASGRRIGQRVDEEVMAPLSQAAGLFVDYVREPERYATEDLRETLYSNDGEVLLLIGQAYASYADIVRGEMGQVYDGLYGLADNSSSEALAEKAKELGWASSGSFYMAIARIVESHLKLGEVSLDAGTSPNYNLFSPRGNVGQDVGEVFWQSETAIFPAMESFKGEVLAAGYESQNDRRVLENFDNSVVSSEYKWLTKAMNKVARILFYPIVTGMQPDPFTALVHMVDFGHKIIEIATELLFIALGFYIAGLAAGAVAEGGGGLPLLGGVIKGLGNMFQAAANLLTGVIKIIGFVVLAIGLVHAYLIPMMPYIFMFFFVTGMLILIGEALIAAPIWAFMHVRMDGQDFVDQSQKPGYMIAFNLFLRPTLAVLGLALSMTIFSASIYFMNQTFDIAARMAMPDDRGNAIIGVVSMLILQVYLHYQVGLRSFQLITQVPDRVSRWFGAQSEGLGEDQDSKGFVGAMVGHSETRIQRAAGDLAAASKIPDPNETSPQGTPSAPNGGNQGDAPPQGGGKPANKPPAR